MWRGPQFLMNGLQNGLLRCWCVLSSACSVASSLEPLLAAPSGALLRCHPPYGLPDAGLRKDSSRERRGVRVTAVWVTAAAMCMLTGSGTIDKAD